MERRIETKTSRTAEWTCTARAVSAMEADPLYRCGDWVAPRLLPGFARLLLGIKPVRMLFVRAMAPPGVYEYVVARTKYIDAAFCKAIEDRFDQVLIFGAGFDTRAVRFPAGAGGTRIFELDIQHTQRAKTAQYARRGIAVPPNLVLVPIDLDREPLTASLDGAGFDRAGRSLFILEGLVMYLEPASVEEIFGLIGRHAARGSRVVFDCVYSSVLKGENRYYGERELYRRVAGTGEGWRSGMEKADLEAFLGRHRLRRVDIADPVELEKRYFQNSRRVNGTHFLVTAEKSRSRRRVS